MPVDMRRVDPFEGVSKRRRPPGTKKTPSGGTPASLAGTGEEVAAEDYGFDLPEAWSGLEDFWSNLMGGGMDVGMGPQYGSAMNWLENYMQQGMPVDIEKYEEMKRPYHMMQMEKANKEAMEMFGLSGIGQSTMATQQLGQIGKEFEAGFASDLAQHWYSAQEADMSRRMAAAMGIPGFASMGAGVNLANVANRRGGADSLLGYGFAPLQLGQGLFNMGQGYQDAQAMGYNQMYNDPAFAQAMQYGMGGPGSQYMPDQYLPGWGTQLMDMGGMFYGQTQDMYDDLASAMTGGGGGGMPTDFFASPGGPGASYDFSF